MGNKFEDIYEMQRWFLFIPVFIGTGISFYFSINFEPNLTLTTVLGVFFTTIGAAVVYFIKKYLLKELASPFKYGLLIHLNFIIQMFIAVVVGFCAAKARTDFINQKPLSQSLGIVKIDGFIDSVEDVARGTLERPRLIRRIIIKDIKGLPIKVPNTFRVRVQGTIKKFNNIELYNRIVLEADIFPVPFPLTRRGYDAPFEAYFNKISAFGKLKKVLSIYEAPLNKTQTIFEHINSKIQLLRTLIKQKLVKNLSSEGVQLALALVTGDKSGITLKNRENFTRSGLSHILAISGLHMGILATITFFICLKFLVLIPGIANNFIIKKIAAVITIIVSFFYLLISGVSFSALRASIMVSISMIAIIMDQRSLSLRCTALAATIILLIFPESVYSISFQLSFASVVALCAFYENGNVFVFKRPQTKKLLLLVKLGNFFMQSIFSTLIATAATTPLTIYCFQRFTLVGILGNLFAIPLLGTFIMPLCVLALSSLFFFENGIKYVFRLFNFSLELLAMIAQKVSDLPFSNYTTFKPSLVSLLIIISSVIWFLVWKTKRRFLAIGSGLFGLFLFFHKDLPDIYYTNDIVGARVCDTAKNFSNFFKNEEKFLISDKIFASFHAKVWSQECGIEKIEAMNFKQRDSYKAKIWQYVEKLPKDSVFFFWDVSKSERRLQPKYQIIDFKEKKRPWYAR